ncbi:hypothetical protein HY633_03775 [Candidatus Uhrbacteria bacterium]|nr:hypothetical protein [Candidatus Uhrbacteria bacterium]
MTKKTTAKVSKKLRKIYGDAKKEGIWIREYKGGTGYLAAAGYMKVIEAWEKKLSRKIDIEKLELGDVVAVAAPGTGKTREEACENAVTNLKKSEKPRRASKPRR